MGKTARSVVDTILGEAVSGSRQSRFEDMMAIASTISNRAAATGVSMEDIVSAPNQYSAYGRSLPPGVEAYRSLAEAALAEVQKNGPTTTAQYYATPGAVRNLPSGLTQVGQTKGHTFFEDPAARPMVTAVGVRQPGQVAYDVVPDEPASPASALDAIFGLGGATAGHSAPTSFDDELDAVFGLEPATNAPASLADDLDAVFGFEPTSRSTSSLGSIDDPAAEWDGTFSNPLGAITNRSTDEFGLRNAPTTSLGVGSTNHKGIDLSAERGQLGYAAEAIGPGTVTSAGYVNGYGNAVTVEHPNGFTSRYGHLGTINVNVGDEIARGTPIGTVGASGNVSGPHLHLEVRDQLGNAMNPRDVVDMSMRDTISPTSRPMSPTEQRNAASAYSGMAASLADAGVLGVGRGTPASSGLPSGFDVSRFAGDIDPSDFGAGLSFSAPSAPASPASGYTQATAEMPSSERFGRTAEVDPARLGGGQQAGFAAISNGPVSPSAGYALAEAPASAPSAERFGGQVASQEPSPERFGHTATPSFAGVSGPFSPSGSYASASTPTGTTVASASLARPDNLAYAGPKGSFNVQNIASLGDLNALSAKQGWAGTLLGMPASKTPTSVVPSIAAMSYLPNTLTALPAMAPKVTPMVTPMARVSQQTPRSAPTPAPRPSFSAYDVYSGRAPTGYQAPASGGNLVSRDAYGNTHVTNEFGVTTTTDPSGRQMGNLGGFGQGMGGMFDKVSPGMVGSLVGGALGGVPGAIIGGAVGNRMGGQQSNQKSGGLGGLGGWLADLFDGGSSGGGGRGGGSGSSGSRGGGGGGRSSPGADRSQAGNQ